MPFQYDDIEYFSVRYYCILRRTGIAVLKRYLFLPIGKLLNNWSVFRCFTINLPFLLTVFDRNFDGVTVLETPTNPLPTMRMIIM